MNNIMLFLFGCIPMRLGLSLLAYKLDKKYLFFLGIVLGLISVSFLYLFFSNSRLYAQEANNNTWWHNYRLIHGMLYLTAAIYAFRKESYVWIPLLIDVCFGLIIFINYRF